MSLKRLIVKEVFLLFVLHLRFLGIPVFKSVSEHFQKLKKRKSRSC